MSTPYTRRTDNARRFRIDVDTGVPPTVAYQQLLGVETFTPRFDPRIQDDETIDDEGWGRDTSTGTRWRLEIRLKNSLNPAGTIRDPVHAFLFDKHLNVLASDILAGEFGVRWYDRTGLPEAFEGRAYVRQWEPQGGSGDPDIITVTLQGQGKLERITNPAASQLPVVESLSPTSGPAAGGNLVEIYGHHFTGATAVTFGATAALDFSVVHDGLIVAIAPSGIGTVDVTVTTPSGQSANTPADDYTHV